MKRVSFEVAKMLKEAGYPQIGEYWYDRSGLCCYSESNLDEIEYIFAPFVMEVWLWLWKERHIALELFVTPYDKWVAPLPVYLQYDERSDPEEAIETTIEYLVNNNLIK